ncbi:MAG: type II secretion system protein [Thermoguttaceae bacterium]
MRRSPCQQCRSAFTLVEALVSISIVAVAGSVLLLGITSSLQTTDEAISQTLANGMAMQLIDEVVGNRYHSIGADGYQTNLGPSSDELGGAGRERYNDIGDYHGFQSQPPQGPFGIELGQDDGDGGIRHPNFVMPEGRFDNWREEIEVYYVNESDLTTRLPVGATSDYRVVEVRIIHDDPKRGSRELAKMRRVVAYVPPM